MSFVSLFIKPFLQARCVRGSVASQKRAHACLRNALALAAPPRARRWLARVAPTCSPCAALTARSAPRSYAPRAGFTALSSKRGNKNFYKGKGAASTGHHTRKGAPPLRRRRGCAVAALRSGRVSAQRARRLSGAPRARTCRRLPPAGLEAPGLRGA
jgi:hypothetical protein